jgi:hypothetical protein
MRNPVNVFYYPDFFLDFTTLKKAILLFDELHLMDRPSMMFGMGPGQFGTIGAESPLRQYEDSFREEGVPLFVHPAPMGPVSGEWYERVKADANDPEFLRRFQDGLRTSATFREFQIARGNYGAVGDHDRVAEKVIGVDLSQFRAAGSPIALFEDHAIRPFDFSTPLGCAKALIAKAVTCSAKLNFALDAGTEAGFVPLADASPYGDLLGAKYARAMKSLEPAKNKIQLTDLSFAIFDELVPTEKLKQLNLGEVIRYRKASDKAREEFLEHLSVIQSKQAVIGLEGDYAGAIRDVIDAEILPAVRTFKNKLQTIHETLFGAAAKGVVGAMGGSSVVTLFGELSWLRLMALAGAAAAYMAKATIDAVLAERAAKRDCSISYILSLDE